MKLFEELEYRGLVDNITNPELEEKLNKGGLTFYIGTDPTADSLHIGHFSSLLVAHRLKKCGHTPIMLVGGATGLIGDPKPNSERPMITKEELEKNYNGLKNQIQKLFGFKMVNNYDWSKDLNFIDYLRDYGKFFPLSYMLSKDTVKSRMDIGITYTEFSYMIMQSLDFLHLFEKENCTLQIGGQDQWGNITAGIELVRRKTGKQVFGMTMPLITKADGTKFGKSENGTIWLDKDKTSPYEMYQFLLNTEDSKVVDYLKKLTMIEAEEIDKLEKSLAEEPHLRLAGKALAKSVVTFLHGEEEFTKVVKITESLFKNEIASLSASELKVALNGVPNLDFKLEDNIVDLLINSNVASSKRAAREFITSGAIYIKDIKITDLDYKISEKDLIDNEFLVLRRGKKKYYTGIATK